MFSLLLFLCVWVSVYFLCMCVLVGRVFVCMCMCLSHLSCLCFNVVGLFVLMHCSIFFFRLFCCCFHFHFVSACVGVFCFQFSLPITKYFVCFCFAYNWMFCLRSHIHSTKVIFFLCEFLFFICGWCLFLWPLLVHCLCLCVGCVGYSFSLCAFLKYLDQRVGFFTAFQWFFLLRVQEFKSFVFLFCFSFVLIFPPSSLSLFLCYFCFNLSGCLFSLKLTC